MFAAIILRGTRESVSDYAKGENLLASLMPCKQADVYGVWQDRRALIAQATHHNTPESLHEKAPETCAETGRVIASWVRLDNRDELCTALRVENRPSLTDPQIILAAHRLWGGDCAKRLEGDFSFVIYDPVRQETYCARDSIGAKPFFYHLGPNLFVAATSVAAIRTIERLKLTPNLLWAVLFLVNLNFARDQAAYDGVMKLAPAHDLTIGIEGTPAPREYFRFDLVAPHTSCRDDVWVERYREAFDHAVKVRTRSAFLIGSESSAGLDSSSIAATLVEMLPHSRDDFHCFGYCMYEYEPELMLSTAAMCDLRHSHVLMKPESLKIDDTFERAVKALGHPPEHWMMMCHPAFFTLGQSLGIRTLFSGYGGDEVVTSQAQHFHAELWERRAIRMLIDELPGSYPMRLARFGKMLIKGPMDPQAWLRNILRRNFELGCIRRDVMEDGGFRQLIEEMSVPETGLTTLNALAANDPAFRLARSTRMESGSIFAATFGIEYRWPLYDRALVQQYFSTPSIEKRRRDMGRYLHRRAMTGRIPEQILWQKGKSMGGHLHGTINVQKYEPEAFSELPELMQTLIDADKYERQREALLRAQGKASEANVNNTVFAWQRRQLVKWLN